MQIQLLHLSCKTYSCGVQYSVDYSLFNQFVQMNTHICIHVEPVEKLNFLKGNDLNCKLFALQLLKDAIGTYQ